MRYKLITAPAEEALSVDYVKSSPELRITDALDDERIERMIKSARQEYEAFSGRILISSTYDLYLDEFPDVIELPPPLVSATITYYDTAGALQTLAPANYVVDTVSEPGRITRAYGCTWPSTYGQANVVIVRFIAGYTNADAVPDQINDGLLLYIQQMYDGTDRRLAYESCWWNLRVVPV